MTSMLVALRSALPRYPVACLATLSMLWSFSANCQENVAAGRWRVHGWLDGNDLEAQCTLIQHGRLLGGTCTTEQGAFEVTGQSQGAAVSWSYEGDSGGMPATIRYSGSISLGRMIGKISVTDNPDAGAFKAELIR